MASKMENDAVRTRMPHFLCGSFSGDESGICIVTPEPNTPFRMIYSGKQWRDAIPRSPHGVNQRAMDQSDAQPLGNIFNCSTDFHLPILLPQFLAWFILSSCSSMLWQWSERWRRIRWRVSISDIQNKNKNHKQGTVGCWRRTNKIESEIWTVTSQNFVSQPYKMEHEQRQWEMAMLWRNCRTGTLSTDWFIDSLIN